MEKDTIIKTFNVLRVKVFNSSLTDSEKNAVKLLIDKLEVYYLKQYSDVFECKPKDRSVRKEALFCSSYTDHVVAINDTINRLYDVYGIVNTIYKDINYDEKKGRFKIKRLNK